jgi:DNA ligase-1
MSEKLDGLRCIWTGKELITRNGTKLNPPAFFTRAFPNSCLDGELYAGKNGYRRVVAAATSGQEPDWLQLSFCVFDAPLINLQFSQRYNVGVADPRC